MVSCLFIKNNIFQAYILKTKKEKASQENQNKTWFKIKKLFMSYKKDENMNILCIFKS